MIVCKALALNLSVVILTGRVTVRIRICIVTICKRTRISFPTTASLLMSVWPWQGRSEGAVRSDLPGSEALNDHGDKSRMSRGWPLARGAHRMDSKTVVQVRATVLVALGLGAEQNGDWSPQAEATAKDSWRQSAGPRQRALMQGSEHGSCLRISHMPYEWLRQAELGPKGRKCR